MYGNACIVCIVPTRSCFNLTQANFENIKCFHLKARETWRLGEFPAEYFFEKYLNPASAFSLLYCEINLSQIQLYFPLITNSNSRRKTGRTAFGHFT